MTTPAVTQEIKSTIKTFGTDRLLPGTYTLALSQVAECPVELNEERLTFVEAVRRLVEEKAMPSSEFRPDYKTENASYILTIPKVESESDYRMREIGLANVFRALVELSAKGVNVDKAIWFYFDFDWSNDADVSHSFFVVYDGKIVDEECHFCKLGAVTSNKKRRQGANLAQSSLQG
jgi:hypothetical protein